MKLLRLVPAALGALAAALFLLAGYGCAKPKAPDLRARVTDAIDQAKSSLADTWKDVRSYTYEKRQEFTDSARDLSNRMDNQVQQLRAHYSEAKASASRKAAMKKLKDCEADFKEKVAALGRASADSWDRARQAVVESWDRLQDAYAQARKDD